MRRITTGRSPRVVVAVAAATLLLGACGGDDATDAAGDAAAYCDLVETLESQDSRPTDEQLEQLVAVAPAEIRDDVELFADAIGNDDMEAEGVGEAESNILAWEEDNCT